MSCSRSVPAEWMTLAYSTCLGVRLRAGFCASSWARMSSEFRGVRSSWLMLARNSLLYLDASASCWARSSSSWRACSISLFFVSMSRFCWASSSAFSSSSALESLEFLLLRCNSDLELGGQTLRLDEQGVGPGVGHDRVDVHADGLDELAQEGAVDLGEAVEAGQLENPVKTNDLQAFLVVAMEQSFTKAAVRLG